jgi:3-deoxy-D-manno-octulosonic-acid transferase
VLSAFGLCLAQDEVQAERFRSLGAPRVDCVGDLKSAAPDLPCDGSELARLRGLTGRRPLWLAASTHAGEEEIAARVHRGLSARYSDLLTIIAPRHPVRSESISAMLRGHGLRVAVRARGEPLAPETQIYLVDTLGELGLFYRLAGIAFIGGSLVAKGGHNPFEAARLGCAVLHGPDMSNCAAMASSLTAVGASETVRDDATLAQAVSRLLADPRRRTERTAAAAVAAVAGLGILEEVAARLAPWLDQLAPERDLAPPRTLRA